MFQTENNRPGPLLQLAILFGLVSVCSVLGMLLVKLTLPLLFDINDPVTFMSQPENQLQNIGASLFMQSVVSSWGMFLIPSILFVLTLRFHPFSFFRLKEFPGFLNILLAILMIISAAVFLNILVSAAKQINLPESLSHLRSSQELKERLFQAYFANKSATNLVVLITVLAALPAISEELFFRGIVQQIFFRFTSSPVLSIFISGLTFSLMHLEFDNFLAIWFMGGILGAMFHYSNNLWLPIIAHFSNNSLMILLKYFYLSGTVASDMSEEKAYPFYISFIAGVFLVFLVWRFLKLNYLETLNTSNE